MKHYETLCSWYFSNSVQDLQLLKKPWLLADSLLRFSPHRYTAQWHAPAQLSRDPRLDKKQLLLVAGCWLFVVGWLVGGLLVVLGLVVFLFIWQLFHMHDPRSPAQLCIAHPFWLWCSLAWKDLETTCQIRSEKWGLHQPWRYALATTEIFLKFCFS